MWAGVASYAMITSTPPSCQVSASGRSCPSRRAHCTIVWTMARKSATAPTRASPSPASTTTPFMSYGVSSHCFYTTSTQRQPIGRRSWRVLRMLAWAVRIQHGTLTASLSISDGPASRVTVRVPSDPGLIVHACPKTAPRTSAPIFRRFQRAVRWRSYKEREPCVPARTSTCTQPSCVPVVF